MSVNLIILLTPVYVILFWGLKLSIGSAKSEYNKKNLAFFMLCGLFAIISGVAFFLEEYAFYNATYVIVVFFALSQFPSFYVYIYALTRNTPFSNKIYIHYLIPFIAFFVAVFIHWFWLTPAENMLFVTEQLTGNNVENNKIEVAFLIDRMYKNTFIIFSVFYYILVIRRVQQHRTRMNNYFSNTENVQLNWMKIFYVLFLFLLGSGIFYHGSERELFVKKPLLLIIPYGTMAVFYWVIGHFGSTQKGIYGTLLKDQLEAEPTLVNATNPDFENHLNTIMLETRPYLNAELSLPDLAVLAGTNRTYLSKHINEKYKLNFKQFINNFRLIEAEKLLLQDNEDSIMSVFIQCGFSSYHTFNRCFKEKYGMSPGNFRKEKPEYHIE